ncbi:hypothetical protein [Sphingomonas sp.]|jgi:hypothetical protein|uniref:hypothetical protein n=1 Tax=Sphingomonas sp. TaxID=28214 RepID=UPI002ED801BB
MMKLFAFAAAGLAMLAGLAPVTPAVAAPQRTYQERRVVTQRTVVRTDDRRYRTRKVCRMERRRNGNRVRICRTVRR